LAAAKNVGFAYGFNVHDEDVAEWGGSRPDTTDIPEEGALVRDVIYGSNFVASHLVHFYQLAALDFIDPLAANLNKPPFCPRYGPPYNPGDPVYDYYYRVPTAGGTSGTTNMNVYLVAQYVLALQFRRMCNQIGAIWGGRAPFVQGLTPGGVATSVTQEAIDKTRELLYEGPGGTGTPSAPAAGTILKFIGAPTDFALFVNLEGGELDKLPIAGDGSSVYAGTHLFDVVAVAMLYPEYFWLGNAYERFLAYGVFEQGDPSNPIGDNRLLSRGRKITGAEYSTGSDWTSGWAVPNPSPPEWKPAIQGNVYENISSSWYRYGSGAWKHPWRGETKPRPQKTTAYSWVKSPRYRDATDPGGFAYGLVPYEAGPLARMQVNGNYYAGILYDAYVANGVSPTIPIGPFAGVTFPRYGDPAPHLGAIFPGVGGLPNLAAYGLTYNGDSALDRYAARQLECWKVANAMVGWLNRLETMVGNATSITRTPPADQFYTQSFGWTEAPRGALGHWMKVSGPGPNQGKIEKYQCVVPSTWNASPRDANGNPGPAEKAMEDVYVHDVNHPLEILRISHSWDFCTACAVHIVKPNKRGKKVEKIVHMDPTYL
jgi:Ni,Fe-hydrogenase I large subunit